MLTVERSPAKVSWMLMCNGILIVTESTRKLCEDRRDEYARKYGLTIG